MYLLAMEGDHVLNLGCFTCGLPTIIWMATSTTTTMVTSCTTVCRICCKMNRSPNSCVSSLACVVCVRASFLHTEMQVCISLLNVAIRIRWKLPVSCVFGGKSVLLIVDVCSLSLQWFAPYHCLSVAMSV